MTTNRTVLFYPGNNYDGRCAYKLTIISVLLLYCYRYVRGTVTISPPGIAPVCSGHQLELACTVPGSQLEWRFNVFRGNEPTAIEISRIIVSNGPASAVMSQTVVNSTTFDVSRTSAEDSLPVISRLLINPVSNNLSGTVMNCVDLDTSALSSTTVIVTKIDPFQEINVREQQIEFENDSVTVILEWDGVNPQYSVNVSVIPELQVNISRSTAQLEVIYNTMYNVSVIVSPPCDQSSMAVFTEVYYYPRTSPPIHTCGDPEAQTDNSVTVLRRTDPAVEGTTVTFHCPGGLVLEGSNSSTCMENGEWEPALYQAKCLGGSFSGLTDDGKIAVATSVTVFVLASILLFIVGFLCMHFCQKKKKINCEKTQDTPYYEEVHVVLKQERELVLEENVAYGQVR